jgi:hypothetical protein
MHHADRNAHNDLIATARFNRRPAVIPPRRPARRRVSRLAFAIVLFALASIVSTAHGLSVIY